MKLWRWWIQDAMGCKPKTFGRNAGRVEPSSIAFAVFMTSFLGLFALLFGLVLLSAIIASKGVVLMVLGVVGGLIYGVWKAIEATANGSNS